MAKNPDVQAPDEPLDKPKKDDDEDKPRRRSKDPERAILANVGEIVIVRVQGNQFVPAIVVNDFGGDNAPGAVSLLVFMPNPLDATVPFKFVPMASHVADAVEDNTLLNEPFLWWHGQDEPARIIKPKEAAAAQ